MTDAMAKSTGPYLHAAEWKAVKSFETEGAPRRFLVLIASAYNAGGLIGPEHNGIAIIDEDNRCVVLDRHVEQQSGSFGPSTAQRDEFRLIMEMDWNAFRAFVADHPRYRGSVPDLRQGAPDEGRAEQSNHDIIGERNPADPTPMPLKGRREIIEFLQRHHGHSSDGRGYDFCIAWDIKMHGDFDTSGTKHAEEYRFDHELDARWEEFVESDPELFYICASDALRHVLDGEYTTWIGDDQGRYDIGVSGRSGGHLVLAGLDGHNMTWNSRVDFCEWLEEAEDEEIADLYRLVASMDRTVERRYAEMEHQFAFQRSLKEQDWKQEHASEMVV